MDTGPPQTKQSAVSKALMGMEGILANGSRERMIEAGYASHFADLVRLCGALGEHDDAEDIAQEVLLFARSHCDDVRDETRIRSWLRTIAVRRLYRLRSRRADSRLPEELVYSPDDPELHLDLAAAIVKLPAREREVLTLFHGLGYSQEEVATALGIRRGTVAAALFHARAKLAASLSDYDKGAIR